MICTKCKIDKPVLDFNIKKMPDKRQSYCKMCQNVMSKRHYISNKSAYIANATKRKKYHSRWLTEIKASLKCERCPENHPSTLDFHHPDPSVKEYAISKMRDCSREKVLSEIKKCIVLCSNCHRKEHAIS